jgi:hypothetical protein
MRVIKLGIISVIFFAIFLTLLSFLFPSHVRISKAIDIRTGKDSLIGQLGDPANWQKWYPGADTADLIPNGIRTHDGKELIVDGITDSTVTTLIRSGGTKKSKSGWNIFPGGTPDTYTVQWYMDIHLRWSPWEKFSGLLMEKRYGPMMEKGLDNLKALLEK